MLTYLILKYGRFPPNYVVEHKSTPPYMKFRVKQYRGKVLSNCHGLDYTLLSKGKSFRVGTLQGN